MTLPRTSRPVDPAAAGARILRTLYVTRFGFALVWAVLLATTADTLGVLAGTLLVLYPLVDVAAAVIDLRSSARPSAGLTVTIGLSLAAAVGLAAAATSGEPAVLRVWGAWAITAGIVQLVVAAGRRGLGGQWPQIVSGSVSALLGVVFVVQAGGEAPSLASVAGYAVGGGVLFLVSALRLRRSAQAT